MKRVDTIYWSSNLTTKVAPWNVLALNLPVHRVVVVGGAGERQVVCVWRA